MIELQPKLNALDTSVWGVEAHNASLHIDVPMKPSSDCMVVIDVENNLDGSFAGLGWTMNGKDIFFLSKLPEKDFLKGVSLVGHNVKYDVQMLRKWGMDVSADQIVWDTQLAEYVKDSTKQRYGLKKVVEDTFSVVYPDYKSLTGTGKKAVSIGTLPLDVVANYNGCDVLFTCKLMEKQMREMTSEQINYLENIEIPTCRVLLEMEERGVQIDAAYIKDLDTRFANELSVVVDSIRNRTKSDFSLNSPVQVKRLLMDQAGICLQSTAAEELRKHEDVPLIKDILRYRELTKLRSTYTNVLLEKAKEEKTYRLHARFNQTSTITGRLSSSEPNLQNIPTRTSDGDAIRGGFRSKEGHVLLDSDYSQIEPRLMAHFSQDPVFLQIFKDDKSIYDAVVDILGLLQKYNGDKAEAKRVAKVMWLALAYNAGAFKLSKAAKISMIEATDFINTMKRELSQFFYWRDKTIKQAEIDGGIKTMFGRWIPLSMDHVHLAPNYLIQGSASELMKLAIQQTRRYSPVLSVHDEMVYELADIPEKDVISREIKRIMENVVELSVPIKVEMGMANTWSEAKN